MEIKFLGTGGAFDYEYGNSSAWVVLGGARILIDCGNTTYAALRRAEIADQIDHILITHFHDDHVGSLCTTILHHKFLGQPARKANILVPNWAFRDQLYEFIRFGLLNPEEYVSFSLLEEMPGITSIDTFGLHVPGMQSYGYLFEDETEFVAYSGDLGDPNIVFDHLQRMPASKPKRVFHEISFDKSDGIHTFYQDLFPRLDQYPLWGYHIDPRQNPADNHIPLVANSPELLF